MNFGNMETIMRIKAAWDTFKNNHPKFPMFVQAVRANGIKEGSVIAISITDPDGKVTETNLRVTASDLELFNSLRP